MKKFQLLLAGLGVFALIITSEQFDNHVEVENFINFELTDEEKIPWRLQIVEHPSHWYQEGMNGKKYRWQVFYWKNVPDAK